MSLGNLRQPLSCCGLAMLLSCPAPDVFGSAPRAASHLTADAASPAAADSVFSNERRVTKLAEGTYTIRHRDPFPGWVHGNTTVIIGARAVLVVDSCQLSDCAREDIAQIRQWTKLPVRYLLNTHWHMDHTGGNKDYSDAFRGVAIIAHVETKKMMDATGVSLSQNMLRDATSTQARLQKIVQSGQTADGRPAGDAQRTTAARQLALIGGIIEQAKHFSYEGPSLVFDHEMSVDLGGREAQIRHLGRGNTAGDAVLYLAKEKILIAGDLLDHPVPYAFDGYPSEWIQTLTNMAGLDVQTIVPGHGDVLHDKTFLFQVIDLMKSVVGQTQGVLNRNYEATLEDVKKSLDLKSYRQAVAGDDKDNAEFFDGSIGTSFVELAYHEAKQR